MRRPNYGAVTGVTAVLAVVCAIRVTFQDLIPPPHPELMAEGRGEYVGQAAAQDVEWWSPDPPGPSDNPGPSAFQEAQRLQRPLLIVVGLPWSGAARQADKAFAEPEVARAINRGFVAIRIDAAKDPRWISQFLPLQRARAGIGPGFQAWTFDLKRRIIDFTSRADAGEDLRHTDLLDALLKSQSDFATAVLSDADPRLEADQKNDLRLLLGIVPKSVALSSVAPALVGSLDADWGGWDEGGLLFDRPLTFRFLQFAGAWPEAGRSLRDFVLSPRTDWLDGGFFRTVHQDDGAVEFDKAAVANAQVAEVLAVQDALRPDPLLRRAARQTVDWLLTLLNGGEDLGGAEAGDEDERGRSRRSSFSPPRLRDAVSSGILTESDRAWALKSLNLDDTLHSVRPTPTAFADPRWDRVLTSLRRAAGPKRKTVALGQCDINGTVAACLLRCARLWSDRKLADTAGVMVDRLEAYQPNPLPRHALTDGSEARPYLGDALAYSDARLEDFLSSGRVPSLEKGAATLRAALKTFGGSERGILRPSPTGTPLLRGLPEILEAPQITDDENEALSATALRLLRAYAAVLGPSGRDFDAYAAELTPHLSAALDALPALGGAMSALARQNDPGAAFVTGPDALAQSMTLARLLPNRLVVPVLGPARPDLRNRPTGFYFSGSSGFEGPLSQAELLRRLPNALNLGG